MLEDDPESSPKNVELESSDVEVVVTVVLAVAMTLGPALTAGCSAEEPPRASGSPVTPAEARLLAGLLHRNAEEGGADFVVTAPYGRTTVLTLHGEIDFPDGTGHAQAVTTFVHVVCPPRARGKR